MLNCVVTRVTNTSLPVFRFFPLLSTLKNTPSVSVETFHGDFDCISCRVEHAQILSVLKLLTYSHQVCFALDGQMCLGSRAKSVFQHFFVLVLHFSQRSDNLRARVCLGLPLLWPDELSKVSFANFPVHVADHASCRSLESKLQ